MIKEVRLGQLYDKYGKLLTEKQQNYFEDYYFENLTLAELSLNYNVTRNAIHKTIKEVEEKLNNYEEILKLYEKAESIKEIIVNLDDNIKNKITNLI